MQQGCAKPPKLPVHKSRQRKLHLMIFKGPVFSICTTRGIWTAIQHWQPLPSQIRCNSSIFQGLLKLVLPYSYHIHIHMYRGRSLPRVILAWGRTYTFTRGIYVSLSTCIASTRYSDKMEMRIVRTANQKRALHISIWHSSEVSVLWPVFASTSCRQILRVKNIFIYWESVLWKGPVDIFKWY